MLRNLPSRRLRALFLCLIFITIGSGKLAAQQAQQVITVNSSGGADFTSISAALAVATGGDVIQIDPGAGYDLSGGSIDLSTMAVTGDITLVGVGGTPVISNGTFVESTFSSHLTLKNLEFDGIGISLSTTENLFVINCTFRNQTSAAVSYGGGVGNSIAFIGNTFNNVSGGYAVTVNANNGSYVLIDSNNGTSSSSSGFLVSTTGATSASWITAKENTWAGSSSSIGFTFDSGHSDIIFAHDNNISGVTSSGYNVNLNNQSAQVRITGHNAGNGSAINMGTSGTGVNVNIADPATPQIEIRDNEITSLDGINVSTGGSFNGGGIVTTILNNTINSAATGTGIYVDMRGAGSGPVHNVTISNNTGTDSPDMGVRLSLQDNATINATVTGNNWVAGGIATYVLESAAAVATVDFAPNGAASFGAYIIAQNGAGDTGSDASAALGTTSFTGPAITTLGSATLPVATDDGLSVSPANHSAAFTNFTGAAGNDDDGDGGTGVSIVGAEAVGIYGGSLNISDLSAGDGTYTPGINVASQTDNIYMLVQDDTQFGLDYSVFGPNVDTIEENALDFLSGGSDFIDMPTPTGLPTGSSVRTVQMAFKRNSTGAGVHTLFSYGDNSVNGLYSVYIDAGDNLFFDYNGTDFNLLEQIDDTNWHHIAVVYNGSVASFYVDGRAAGNPSLTIALTTVSSNVQIGRNIDGATNYADIEVDEFAIFNTIRTQSSIETDVLSGAPIGDASLVAYYNFNQGGVTLDNTEFTVVHDQQFNSDGDITALNRTGAASNFVTSGVPADIVAPDFTVSATSSVTSFGFDIDTDLDESGTTYYVVVADGAAQPSSAEVLAGTGAGGSGELASGTIDNTSGANSATVSGLAGSTAYDVYLVAQDVSGNSQRNAETQLDVTTSAATALAAGDVTFTMINSSAPQEFAFMLNQPVVAGTQIYFTDEGFDNGDNPSSLEGIISFVATQSHSAGAQIIVDPTGLSAMDESGSATGSVANPNSGFSLSQEDQIIAFQGTLDGAGAILTIDDFLGAINTNTNGWVTNTSGVNDSALPSTLDNGTTANSLYDGGSADDNAVYDFSETTGYLPNLQAYINDASNWLSQASTPYDFNDISLAGGNNAPTITAFTGFTGPNTLRVLEANVFGFTDVDAVDAQLASIEITGLGNINTFGTLFYDIDGDLEYDGPGEDVGVNDVFTYDQLENNELVLLLGSTTGGPATFDYTVSDGGLSSTGGSFTGFIIDNSLHFAGTDDLVNVPYDPSLNAFDVTVEGWFYVGNVSGTKYLVGRSGTAQDGDYRLTLEGGVPRFSVYGTVWTDVDATTTTAVSNWYHIAGVKEGTDLKIYVNGILENTVTGEGISASSTNDLELGAVTGASAAEHYIGEMDEVRIWNYGRSAKEIRANAAAVSDLTLVDGSLIAYYTFDTGDAGNANNSPGSEENRLEDFSFNLNDGDLSYATGFALTGSTSNWITSTKTTHVSALTPEINVLVDGVNYADGDPAYDFGTVATGGPFQDVTITIENVSLGTSALTGLVPGSVAVSNGTDFAIQTAPVETSLNAGDTDEFVVRFTPSTTGSLNSTLNNTLVSSDAGESPYNISFTGMGSSTVSEIDVQGNATSIPSGSDFADANTGDDTDFGSLGYSDAGAISKTFDIISETGTDVDVTDIQISGSPNFTLDLTGWTFPGSNLISTNQTFGVNYFSGGSEVYDESATITITNNDPNEGLYTFVVRANAGDHSLHFEQTDGNRTTTDFVTSPISAALGLSNNVTLEAWIRTTSSQDDQVFSLEQGDNNEFMQVRINEVAGFVSANIYLGGTESIQGSQVNVTDGNWHHIALVADGTDARLYVDGIHEGSATGVSALDYSDFGTGQVLMARNPNSNNFEYEGEIDEFRVWQTSRTISEIREHAYDFGLSDGNIVVYYDFNLGEAEANNVGLVTLTDLSGNGLNGTLSNFASTGTTGNFLPSLARDVDIIPPAYVSGYPFASNNGPSGFDIEVQLTEPGTYYYTVNADGVTPADQTAIVNGDDSQSGQHGSVEVSGAYSTFSVNITGLSISTTYDVFLFAEDNNGNTQDEITEIADVTTTAANNAPVIANLDATAASTFVEDGTEIIIDNDVTFSDTEFDGTNYDGSFIAILRDGGTGNSDDVFGFNAFSTYTLNAGHIENSGTPIAEFNTSTPGELYIDFNQGESVSQADVNGVLQNVTYSNTNDNPPASVLIDYTPHDGISAGAEVSITINITPNNDLPSLTVSSPVAFTEDAGAIILDGTIDFIDPELSAGGDFDGSSVTIQRNGGADSNDEFSFTGDATYDLNAGFIRDISGAPFNVATWTHVAASGILTVDFDQGAAATNTVVNDVLRLIEYNNANNTPPASVTLDLTPDDGTGSGSAAAIVVNITPANDAPTIAVTSPGAFTEGGGAVILDGTMAFNDPELIAADDFENADLTIVRNGGANANDEFSFTGDATYDLNAGFIRDISGAPFNVATWTHVAASGTLTITFDQAANPTSAETNAILQLIEYNNPNTTPPASVVLDITGNDGAISGSATQLTVNITATNNVPTLTVSTPVAFTEDAGAVILDGTMTFADDELAAASDFDNSVVTIVRNGGADANDEFSFAADASYDLNAGIIRDVTGPPVGLATWTHVAASGTLTVTFDQAADVTNTQLNDVLRRIEYNNANDTPPANITLDLTPNDGTGDGSVAQIVVNITAANDLPSLTNLGPAGDSPFLEGGTAVIIDGDVAFVDPELAVAPDYDGAVITIERNGGFNSEDVFGYNDGGGYTLAGGFINNGGNLATFDLTTNPGQLVIDFDQAAGVSLTDVNTILQNVTYSNSSGTPPASVTIDFTPDDGTGAGSAVGTTIDIYNNDSDVVATATLSPTLDYINHTGATVTIANGLKVGELSIRDGGGADTDGAGTTLDAITLQFTNPTLIQEVALFDQGFTTLLASEVSLTGGGSDEAVFTGLSGFTASDDNTFEFSVVVTFNNVGGITDNTDQIDFTVISAAADAGGSQFNAADAGGATPTLGGNNAIVVNATDIEFTDFAGGDDDLPLDDTNEIGIALNVPFSVSVAAVDANGNIDVDYAANVAVVAPTPDATFTGTDINGAALSSGVHTWSDLLFTTVRTSVTFTVQDDVNSYTDTPVFTFDVSDALSDITEDLAFVYPVDIDYTSYSGSITSQAVALQVAQFIVADGGFGLGPDTDSNSTRLDNPNDACGSGNSSTVCPNSADAFRIQVVSGLGNIDQIALYILDAVPEIAANTEVGEYDAATHDGGSGIFTFNFDDDNPNWANNDDYDVPDGETRRLGVYVTFKQGAGDITDNEEIKIEVTNVYWDSGRSGMANSNGAPAATPGDAPDTNPLVSGGNQMEVIGDRLIFSANNPTSATYERATGDFDFTVQAQDAIGNVDLDETSELLITSTGGAIFEIDGSINTTFNLTAGEATPTIYGLTEEDATTITVADNDGNTGSQGTATTLSTPATSTVASSVNIHDTTAPFVATPATDIEPDDDALMNPITNVLTMQFNEEVAGVATKNITLLSLSPSVHVISIDADDPGVVSDANGLVTITLPESPKGSRSYSVTVDDGAFDDSPNNNPAVNGGVFTYTTDYAGTTEWNFTTPVDATPPTVTVTRNPITNGDIDVATSDNSVSFDIAFTEEVSNFAESDILVTTSNDLDIGGDQNDQTANNFGVNDIILTPDGDNINWTLTITAINSPTELSTIDITIQTGADRMEDEAGNDLAAPVVSSDFIFDHTAPVHTVDILRTASSSPALTGVIDDLTATLSLSVDGNNYPVTNPGTGTWTLPAATISPALSAGTFNVIVTATDDAGNSSLDGTSNELTVDLTKPTIVAAYLFDHDNSGDLDEVTIEFSEDVQDATVELADWTVGGATPDAVVPFGSINAFNTEDLGMADDQYVTFDVSGSTLGTGLVAVVYTKSTATDIADIAGNENDSDALIAEVDLAEPVLNTAWQYDTDGDGNIDEIVIEMNEEIDENSATVGNFALGNNFKSDLSSVDGIFLSNVANNALDASESDQYVTLDVTVIGTAEVTVDYTAGTLTDASGNSALTTSITTDDQAVPIFVSATYFDVEPTDGDVDEVLVEMSEPITDIVAAAEGDFLISGTTLAIDAVSDHATVGDVVDDQYFTFDITGATGTAALTLDYDPSRSGDADLVDKGGNTLAAAANSSVNPIDAAVPRVTNVTSNDADDSYRQGDLIQVRIEFTESVVVGGQPLLTLETGATDRDAQYTSGTGTNTIVLGYSVQSGDASTDLDYVGTGSLTLNGGSIDDASTNAAVLTLENPGDPGSLGANKDIVVDNVAPSLNAGTSFTLNNAALNNLATVSFDVDFDDDIDPATITFEDFTVIITGDLTFDALEAADLVVSDAVNAIYTLSVTNIAQDGTIKLRVGTDYQDEAGNFAASPVTSTPEYTIDNTPPEISFSTVEPDPTNTNPFVVTINFDESVNGLEDADFTVTNGAATLTGGPGPLAGAGPFTLNVAPSGAQTGNYTVSLDDATVTDDAGNTNVHAALLDFVNGFDNEAPTITASTVVEGRDLTLTSQINETGTVYWGVYTDGATPPTPAQLIAGTGAISFANVTHNLAANDIDTDILLTADNTDFDLYIVSEDDLTPANQEASATLINVRSGGVIITAPTLTNICLEGDALVLGDIVILEDAITDFRSSGTPRTLKLELPTGFEFNTSAAGDGVSRLAGGDISAGPTLAYPASNAVEITYTVLTQNSSTPDQLTITGLEVMAVGSTDYTGVTITRTGGSGDIYLASEGDARTFATLTSEPPFNAPQIVLADPADGHPYMIEDATNTGLGNTLGDAVVAYTVNSISGNLGTTSPFTLYSLSAANTVTVYSDENLTTPVVGPSTGATSYSPTLTNLGLTTGDLGITNFWVTVTDGISCESEGTKYSVAIVESGNSAGETVYTVDDDDGTTIAISIPVGYTGLLTGNGLNNFNYNDNTGTVIPGPAASVDFIPSLAGLGNHTLQYALTAADGVEAIYQVDFIVNSESIVFDAAMDKTLCNLPGAIPLVLEDPDPGNDPALPDFHDIEVYRLEDSSPVAGAFFVTPTVNDADWANPTSLSGWSFDPEGYLGNGATVGDTLVFRMLVQNNSTGGITTHSIETLVIYSIPRITGFDNGDADGTFDRFYCSLDGDFDITADVESDIGNSSGNIGTGYTLTYFGADNAFGGIDDVVYDLTATGFPHNDFSPTDPNRENADPATQIGTYRISYTTPTLPSSAAGCVATIETDIAVLAEPATPTLSNNFTGNGGLVGMDYIVEYTEGTNVVPDPAATTGANSASERFNWYNDISLVSEIDLDQPVLDLDGTNAIPNTNGALTKNIYFTTDHYYDSLGLTETFAGCTSPVRLLSVEVYEVPDDVVVDYAASTVGYEISAGEEYIYEYCGTGTVALDNVILVDNMENVEPNQSYYTFYADDGAGNIDLGTRLFSTYGTYSTSFDPTETNVNEGFNFAGTAPSSITVHVIQTDRDNTEDGNIVAEYAGAQSNSTKITIVVNETQAAPDINAFNTTYISGSTVDFYICEGEEIEQIETPSVSGSVYEWATSLVGPAYVDQVGGSDNDIAAFSNRLVTEQELKDHFSYDPDAPGVYTYYVRQYTDENQSIDFVGCPSAWTTINVEVLTDPIAPTFDENGSAADLDGSANLELRFCEGDLSSFTVNVSGDDGASATDDPVEFSWYTADETGAILNTTPRHTGASATGIDLGVTAATEAGGINLDGNYYFVVSQTNYINENGSGYPGCETEEATMALLTISVRDVPGNPVIQNSYAEYSIVAPAMDFTAGEVITGATSGATATVVSNTGTTLRIENIDGVFELGEDIDNAGFTKNSTINTFTQINNDFYYCSVDVNAVQDIVAQGEAGVTFNWYSDADLTVPLAGSGAGDNTLTAANAGLSGTPAAGDYTFYVTQNQDEVTGFAGCEGVATAVTVHILSTPATPDLNSDGGLLAISEVICDNGGSSSIPEITVLNPAGGLYNWYQDNNNDDDLDGGDVARDFEESSGSFTPLYANMVVANDDVTANHYIVQQLTNQSINSSTFAGCPSLFTSFDITIHDIPVPPTATGNSGANSYIYCADDPGITTLTISNAGDYGGAGVTFNWYSNNGLTQSITSADGGLTINADDHASFPDPLDSDVNETVDYYVTTTEDGCSSDEFVNSSTNVTYEINGLPTLEIWNGGTVGSPIGTPADLTDQEFCFSEDADDDQIFYADITLASGASNGSAVWSISSTGTTYNVNGTNDEYVTFDLDGSYSDGTTGRGEVDAGTPETFDLTYTYTDSNGCISAVTETMTVDPLPYMTILNDAGVTFDAVPENYGSAVRLCEADHNVTDYIAGTEQDIVTLTGNFGANFIGGTGLFSIDTESNTNEALVTSGNVAQVSLSVLGDSIEIESFRTFDIIFSGTDPNGCANTVIQPLEVQALPEYTFNQISGGCENPAVEFVPESIFDNAGAAFGRDLPYTDGDLVMTWGYYRTNTNGSINFSSPYPPTDIDPYDPFATQGTQTHDLTWDDIVSGDYSVAADGDGDIRDFGSTGINESFIIEDEGGIGEFFGTRLTVYTDDANQCLNNFQNEDNDFANKTINIKISPTPSFRWEKVALGDATTFYMKETRLEADEIEDIFLFWDQYVIFDSVEGTLEDANGALVVANDTISQTGGYTVPIPTIDLSGEADDVFEYTIDPGSNDSNLNPFTEARQYVVSVAFRTNNDCFTTISKPVTIVPSIDVAGDYGGTYHQTFGPDGDGTEAFSLITSGWFPENLKDDVLQESDSANSIRPYSWTYGDLNDGSGNGLISNSVYPQVEGSDGYAWHTAAHDEDTDTYNYLPSEDSWIYSPAFDITGMSRPMVKFTMIHNFGAGNEGAVLQHSTDGGVTWVPLGSYETNTDISTGLDWFNFDNVQADPGQQTSTFGALTALGWSGGEDTGESVEWVSARHSLDAIREYLEGEGFDESEIEDRLMNVRFRFAIAATNLDDNDNYFGFALDDFTIQERTKNVLIEQFVSATAETGSSAQALNDATISLKESIDDLIPAADVTDRDEVILAYHTDFGFVDPFNAVNPAGPSARSIYYNVDQVTSILDGQFGGTSSSAKSGDLTWTSTDLSLNSLKDPGFEIVLTPDPNAEETEVKGTVEFIANQDYAANTEFRAYVAILEDTVIRDVGNDFEGFGNVMRKLLPAGSGQFVKLTEELNSGESLPFTDDNGDATDELSIEWNLANITDDAELSAIVFIQNSKTKEIYQSVKIPNAHDFVADKNGATVTDAGNELLLAKDFRMYPNPTDHEVFILFDQKVHEDMEWSIFDQTGRVFDQGVIRVGREGFSLYTDRFPSGLYYMSIRGEKSKFDFKKLMITH